MSKPVYVVTIPDLGWDCVHKVFDSFTYSKGDIEEEMEKNGWGPDQFVIHEKVVYA